MKFRLLWTFNVHNSLNLSLFIEMFIITFVNFVQSFPFDAENEYTRQVSHPVLTFLIP